MPETLDDGGEWSTCLIAIPPELATYKPELQRFWDAMVFKLRRNAHKGKWETVSLSDALGLLESEIEELRLAITNGSTMEILMESSDVANMCLILANISLEVRRDK